LEGSIRFTTNETAALLKPGEQALLNKGKDGVKILHPEDPLNNIAWVNGKFAFSKTPVATVMRELSRWYDIQIQYEGNAAPTTLFTGEVDRMIPLSKLLTYLEKMGSTRFTVEGKTVKVKA
jgi:ferric-dicitrate binding protein FerR (iron transport regulator)